MNPADIVCTWANHTFQPDSANPYLLSGETCTGHNGKFSVTKVVKYCGAYSQENVELRVTQVWASPWMKAERCPRENEVKRSPKPSILAQEEVHAKNNAVC